MATGVCVPHCRDCGCHGIGPSQDFSPTNWEAEGKVENKMSFYKNALLTIHTSSYSSFVPSMLMYMQSLWCDDARWICPSLEVLQCSVMYRGTWQMCSVFVAAFLWHVEICTGAISRREACNVFCVAHRITHWVMLQSSATKPVVTLYIIPTPLCATDLRAVMPQLNGKRTACPVWS